MKYVNEKALQELARNTIVSPRGFRYGYVENFFDESIYGDLVKRFPDVTRFKLVDKQSGGGRKRFYIGPVYYSGKNWGCVCHLSGLDKIWQEVLDEFASDEFVSRLSEATGIGFNSVCDFGHTYGNAGCVQEPHVDGAVRPQDPLPTRPTIACLIYLNENPDGSSGTCVYDTDRKAVLFQVPNLRNSFFFFQQHPNSWHGFPSVPLGEERCLISLSYSQEPAVIKLKWGSGHKLTCPVYWRTRLFGR